MHMATLSSGVSASYPSMCFKQILKKLGHEHAKISWLKIDCEGCEFEVMPSILDSTAKMEQIFIEVHGVQFFNILSLFQKFSSSGFVSFHKELNQWCDGHRCVEYSFMTLEYAKKALHEHLGVK